MAGHIDGSTREYGDGMTVLGEAERVFAVRLLGVCMCVYFGVHVHLS